MAEKKRKKRKYVPGLAHLKFRPDLDWSIEEAKQLYEKAEHPVETDKVVYEDCIEGMLDLPKASVDLIIADPPFGIDFDKMGSQYNRNADYVIEGYQEVQDNYSSFVEAWISQLPRIMKDSSSAFLFSGWTNLTDVLNAVKNAGLVLINHIIWRYQFGVFTKNKFVTSHYHILFLAKNEEKYFFNKVEHYPLDVWKIPRKYRPGQKKNSTKLPEDVVIRCLDFCSKPGDLVFDPFMGNGTTAVCSKLTYRHYIGFEMNPNAQKIIEGNLSKVKLGERYKPYITYKPSIEELLEKYPHLKKQADKYYKPKKGSKL